MIRCIVINRTNKPCYGNLLIGPHDGFNYYPGQDRAFSAHVGELLYRRDISFGYWRAVVWFSEPA